MQAVKVDYVLPAQRVAVVDFDETLSLEEMEDALETLPQVEYAEPNYLRYPTSLDINDTYATLLW